MRLFFAVEVPDGMRKRIDELLAAERRKGLPVKWVKFENLHITLKFLGETSEEKRRRITPVVEKIAGKHTDFQLNLENFGCFPDIRNPRVVWIGVGQGADELKTIAGDLEEELVHFGFKKERRFHAHLTIGRVKKRCKLDDLIAGEFKTDPFRIKEFVLFKSTLTPEGPVYEILQKFTLKQKD